MTSIKWAAMLLVIGSALSARAAEIVQLTESNWDRYAPAGKEVDAIYGDYVLTNGRITAVVANAIEARDINLKITDGGGYLIDLTRLDQPADQLVVYRPIATAVSMRDAVIESGNGRRVALRVGSDMADVRYVLEDGADGLVVETVYKNSGDKPRKIDLYDELSLTKTFAGGHGAAGEGALAWIYDKWFNQAYGIQGEGGDKLEIIERRGMAYDVAWRGEEANKARSIMLDPGDRVTVRRTITPAADPLALRAMTVDRAARPVRLAVTDGQGPVAGALMQVKTGGKDFAAGRTDETGAIYFRLPDGKAEVTVSAIGRPNVTANLADSGAVNEKLKMKPAGYVAAHITDEQGGPIPCKVQFIGTDGTQTPDFFPDSGSVMVNNCHYSHDGRFRQAILPGKYDVIISYGPEYDAIFTTIEVAAGKDAKLEGKLIRTVDTAGWISSDFHSHSSPSGDNTSSQRGRVLNLLCEHIEYAPCTEHQRVDSYAPHLKALGVEHLMATSTGMELTGQPLPLNHHNAFPLKHTPRTQNGGGPRVAKDPAIQIERLALWDDNSDKLVQQNHPNLVQHAFDKNLDGMPDGGFGPEYFGHMDVVEVHPLQDILQPAEVNDKGVNTGRNRIHAWLVLINQGTYRPGVVNTDAHYNFHGSGPWRNWIASGTDDPAKVQTMDIVHASEKGAVVMSNGPFMTVQLTGDSSDAAGPGQTIAAEGGKAKLQVKVQCPNWHDVDRVQVLVNGKADPALNFTRAANADKFGKDVVKFDQTIPLTLEGDAHIIVVAIGDNSTLGPVFGPFEGKDKPVAVSNPIFVDVDGGGFKPNGDTLGAPAVR